MNPFLQSLIVLVMNVLFGGMTWAEAVKKWLDEQVAVLGSREAVEANLKDMSIGVGCDCDPEIDEHGKKCCAENPGKFGDGKFFQFLKTIDWAKFATFLFTIINMIPKGDTQPIE